LLNIFAEKFGKKLAFLTQNKAKLCKNVIITLVFEKNAIFCRKSQTIVIITSTPGVSTHNLKHYTKQNFFNFHSLPCPDRISRPISSQADTKPPWEKEQMPNSGANPTIASCNASVVKNYSAVNSKARF
jgi:hypothetical protein